MIPVDFINKHLGGTACIIGKGPHLDKIEERKHDLGSGGNIIIALNESIHKIESLRLRIPEYVVQQDRGLKGDCVPKGSATHFMNTVQSVPGSRIPQVVKVSPWNPRAVLYSARGNELSAVIALRIAHLMGIKRIQFYCFDSWAGEAGQYASIIGKDSGVVGDIGRHAVNGAHIVSVAKELFKIVEAKFPDVKL